LETCKNCSKEFNETYSFCPYCGQQAKDDLTVTVLFYNTISNYFSFDARFFKSFLPLLLKPGFIARQFVEGKRLRYLHPAQMYLFIAVVFFFLFSFIQRSQVEDLNKSLERTLNDEDKTEVIDKRVSDSIKQAKKRAQSIKDSIAKAEIKNALKNNKFITGLSDTQIDSVIKVRSFDDKEMTSFDFDTEKVDSLIKINASDEEIYKVMGIGENPNYVKKRLFTQALRFYKSRKGGSILQAFYDAIPIAMFFLLPIFALILKLLHIRRGRYAHHLVFSFYYFSFLFTVFSILLGINFITDIPDWIDFLIMLSTFFYLINALKRFYIQGWFKSLFKGIVTAFIFLSIVAPITLVILGFFAFLFY